MENSRDYLQRLAAAAPDELAAAVLRATPAERRRLAAALGEEHLTAILRIAESQSRSPQAKLGNVVVLHGIMGGELTRFDRGDGDSIWVSLWALLRGHFAQLALDPATGLGVNDVRASGILLRYYAAQLVSLARDWNVRPFFFDWRADMRTTADALRYNLDAWFGPDAPAHLVAHSMGGLAARAFIARHAGRWRTLAGRLIMLGTPNYGSFAIPRLLSGNNSVLGLLDKIDLIHSLDDLLRTAATFTSTYQMLPSPSRLPGLDPLFQAAAYKRIPIAQGALDEAREFQRQIAGAIDAERMIYIAGYNRSTANAIADFSRLGEDAGYGFTLHGDGTVPHNLGLLDGVPTYFVDSDHQSLPRNKDVLAAMTSLLSSGAPQAGSGLASTLPSNLAAVAPAPRATPRQAASESRIVSAVARLREGAVPPAVAPEEGELADLLLGADPSSAASAAPRAALRIHVIETPIESLLPDAVCAELRIDAISVGHYLRVPPTGAERDLDRTLAAELPLTRFHERGVLRGALGEQFLLPDPRATHPGGLIVVAGMGRPGAFGAAELSLVARELSLSLSQLGRKHLATVLIGASSNNLTVYEAARAWIDGLTRAPGSSLEAVTFAVRPVDAAAARLTAALFDEAARSPAALDLSSLTPPATAPMPEPEHNLAATRLAIEFSGGVCSYSAMSDGASLAEREIRIHPRRIGELNARLRAENDPRRRLELGRFLLDFLFPRDLLGGLSGAAPVVLACNNAAARIHWELAVQASADSPLALARGLTRQLRTTLAPAPESAATAGDALRVLLVADGSKEHPLPGAQREARALAALFDRINAAGECARIEYTALIGPADATALNLLLAIHDQRPYDVLHYAGHCAFDETDPAASGFLFSGGDILSASDLGRIDRVPRFVFSNACESGALPANSAALAPSFAETFFAKGVGNFVCTAWPVADDAALAFALTFYSSLLGAAGAPVPMCRAMSDARHAIAAYPCWAAYQHYGDPYFRPLRDACEPA